MVVDEEKLMADRNHMRQVEITLRAAVLPDACVGREKAERLVKQRLAETREPLAVIDLGGTSGRCWEVNTVFWETGEVVLATRD